MKSLVSTLVFMLCLTVTFGQKSTTAKQAVDNYLSSKGDVHLEYEIVYDNYDKSSGIWKVQALQLINGIYFSIVLAIFLKIFIYTSLSVG